MELFRLVPILWIVPVAGIGAILFAIWLARDVLRRDTGSPQMRDIGDRILEGAMAFLKRQYITIALLAGIAAVGIGVVLALLAHTDVDGNGVIDTSDKIGLGWRTGVAFLVGAFCSALSGFIGMSISV